MTIAAVEHSSVDLSNVSTLADAMEICQVLAQSDLVPRSLHNKPANLLLIFLNGKELGLTMAQSLRLIYSPGVGQVGMRVQLMLAKLREAGHDYDWEHSGEGENRQCTFTLRRKDNPKPYISTFTVEQALAAKLVKKAPSGDLVAFSESNKPLPWMLYLDDMLFSRAATRCVTRAAPEVLLGFEVIDNAVQQDDVELQPQTAPPAPPPAGDDQGTTTADATAEELAALDAQGRAQAPAEETVPDAEPPADGELAQAPEAMVKKVRALFTGAGWNPRSHRLQLIEACTMFCRRRVASAGELTPVEAGELIAALTVIGRSEEPSVTLGENVAMWKNAWRTEDPDGYAKVMG